MQVKNKEDIAGYRYSGAARSCAHRYLLPRVLRELDPLRKRLLAEGAIARLFDLGCGNGYVANVLAARGWDVTGVDPSVEGIEQANLAYPSLKLFRGSAYDNLALEYGRFPVVVSLEVVEHVYAPREYARTCFNLLEPGGVAIVSTPFHGYWKNVALAITGRMDQHFTALWDHGHIKFWSRRTLTYLLKEVGFSEVRFRLVGRVPVVAKSMIALARKP